MLAAHEPLERLEGPADDPTAAVALLRPYPANGMLAYPVSRRVNAAQNEGPDLIEPIAA